jgi:hypothetical protein
MRALPANVVSYLNKFSNDDYTIEWNNSDNISNVIIVPAIAEYENIKILLQSLSRCDFTYFSSTLILFVVNNSDADESIVKVGNKRSLEMLRSIIRGEQSNEFTEEIIFSGLQIGVIDAASPGKELEANNSGVGLARKVGMDLALTIFDYTENTKKILICLDADCTVSDNYLNTIINDFNYNNSGAAIVNFEHIIDEEDKTSNAIICYELFLRYYVNGLKYARSDYAFHTIGSTMMCDHISYIKVGGMNKRKAAEDFYFLEKLSKILTIDEINSATVYPSGRRSWRVPFGTGQRVNRFMSKSHNEYLLFDPEVFELLKDWLCAYKSKNLIATEQFLNAAKEIHEEIYSFLINNNFDKQWEKVLANTKSERQLIYQKKIWFDGFKTLKFLHHLRDTAFPQINMFDALDVIFMKTGLDISVERVGQAIPSLDIQIDYLNVFRELDNISIHKSVSIE